VTPFQPSLLTWTPPSVSPVASPQGVELARCEGKIAQTVLAFCRARLTPGIRPEFHAQDLSDFVLRLCGGSPESPMRVMRALRRSGQVQVVNVDRSASLYRVEGVR
jgi:hypothetical protein